MHIVHDIAVLDIAATIMGKMTVIHSTLLRDDVGAVLVDTGFPGQPALIRAAMEEAGAPCSSARAAASTPRPVNFTRVGTKTSELLLRRW